jgi:hypothetical protein
VRRIRRRIDLVVQTVWQRRARVVDSAVGLTEVKSRTGCREHPLGLFPVREARMLEGIFHAATRSTLSCLPVRGDQPQTLATDFLPDAIKCRIRRTRNRGVQPRERIHRHQRSSTNEIAQPALVDGVRTGREARGLGRDLALAGILRILFVASDRRQASPGSRSPPMANLRTKDDTIRPLEGGYSSLSSAMSSVRPGPAARRA